MHAADSKADRLSNHVIQRLHRVTVFGWLRYDDFRMIVALDVNVPIPPCIVRETF
jgi:hypothetical protein